MRSPIQPLAAAVLGLGVTGALHAQVAYTRAGQSYTQGFDTLATSGSGNAWANDTTLPGWSLFRVTSNSDATPTAIATYNAGTGSGNSGAFFSFGSSGSSERALGGLGSGTAYFGGGSGSAALASGVTVGWITLGLRNDTGGAIAGFTLGFDGEQWRDGGASTPNAQTLGFEYGFGSTFGGVPSWTDPGAAFHFSSPVFQNTSNGAAVDGNGVGRTSGLGGTVSGVDWEPGETLWLRWTERNDTGSDHGLAIDNVAFSAVPEPEEYAAIAGAGMAAVAWWRRRRGVPRS